MLIVLIPFISKEQLLAVEGCHRENVTVLLVFAPGKMLFACVTNTKHNEILIFLKTDSKINNYLLFST